MFISSYLLQKSFNYTINILNQMPLSTDNITLRISSRLLFHWLCTWKTINSFTLMTSTTALKKRLLFCCFPSTFSYGKRILDFCLHVDRENGEAGGDFFARTSWKRTLWKGDTEKKTKTNSESRNIIKSLRENAVGTEPTYFFAQSLTNVDVCYLTAC